MKILLISPLPPPIGGMATWTKLYINSIKNKKNYYVKIIDTAIKGIRVHNLIKKNLWGEIKRAISIYIKVSKALVESKFDIAHLNIACSKWGMLRDYLIVKKIKKKGIKLILHCHCDTSYQVKGVMAEFMLKKLIKYSDIIICLNQNSEKHIKNLTNKKTYIIPNFIKIDMMQQEKRISKKIKSIIYVGHIIKSKGCDTIINVAKQLPNIIFKLVGFLSDEIKVLDCPNNVLFTGEISKDDVIKEMQKADLLLFPSHTEGFPNVVLEAMAYGLPVIATRVGAIPDMLENKGGIYVDINDVEGIINAIHLLENAEKRTQMSKWNINKVLNNYTVDIVMKQILNIYDRDDK